MTTEVLTQATAINQKEDTAFVGIDLGGARGKSTAVAILYQNGDRATVNNVHNRWQGHPLRDDVLEQLLATFSPVSTTIAVNAPLTLPACIRCTVSQCPGKDNCEVPSTRWLLGEGTKIARDYIANDPNRIAGKAPLGDEQPRSYPLFEPYYHRATEVLLHFQHKILPQGQLGMANGPIGARAQHLVRILQQKGFVLHHNLIEVSSKTTIQALFDASTARAYRKDADPWSTRRAILENLTPLQFASRSGFSKEYVCSSDNCFDALIAGYTAYLKHKEQWQTDLPLEITKEDGWIWAPLPKK